MTVCATNAEARYEVLRVGPNDFYRCRIVLCPEEEGGFSALAMDLPGGISEGESEAEALANVGEAIVGLIESYRAEGRPIPWEEGAVRLEDCPGGFIRYIAVHA